MLSDRNFAFILKDAQGKQVLEMPTHLLLILLASDQRLLEHFVGENPTS